MSYIWEDFNIKPFPAETVVFRDGIFCPELSTLDSPVVDKNYDLPIHFIYVGELTGQNDFDININENIKNQSVYISVKVKVKTFAKLNINIKNSGFGTDLRGFVVIENHGNIDFNIDAHHLAQNTGILIQTRLLAYEDSISKITGTAYIYQYCENAKSNIEFSALAGKNAQIVFSPRQKISSIPDTAEHSANIAHFTVPQVEYLHESGLNDIEVKKVLKDAFINNVDLFK